MEPEKEIINTEEKPVEAPVEEPAKDESISKVLEKQPETVGLDKFLEIKKQNKELTQAVKELTDKVNEGAPKVEISDDLKSITDKFDVDPNFLAALEKVIDKKAEDKIKPLKDADEKKRIDNIFQEHFKAAIERLPDYAQIVNADVIKTLSLDPRNADKTFVQLIEETYGNAITGKRTIDPTKPAGGKEPEPLNVDKARQDPAYFDEVMADPKLKEEYNKAMLERGW